MKISIIFISLTPSLFFHDFFYHSLAHDMIYKGNVITCKGVLMLFCVISYVNKSCKNGTTNVFVYQYSLFTQYMESIK